jgi:hypothetical protein
MTSKDEAYNKRRIAELERMQALNALGLTDQERQAFMERSIAQVSPQLRQLSSERDRMLASSAATGAGQGAANAAIQDEQAARLQNDAALKLEELDLTRKRELELELSARVTAQGMKQKERQAAIAGIAKTAVDTGLELYTGNKESAGLVFGKDGQGSPAAVDSRSILKDKYGMTDDDVASAFSSPQRTQDLAFLNGDIETPAYTTRQASQSGTPWTPQGY